MNNVMVVHMLNLQGAEGRGGVNSKAHIKGSEIVSEIVSKIVSEIVSEIAYMTAYTQGQRDGQRDGLYDSVHSRAAR